MKNAIELKKKLIILCQEIYQPKISEESVNFGTNVKEIIEFAKRNRLAHFLALKYQKLFKNDKYWSDTCCSLIAEYNGYRKKLKNSLEIIKQVLSGKDAMIVKTFSAFPHLTSDVDVLVKDSEGKFPMNIKNEDLWPIHIENKVSWVGADAVSNDFVWRNTQKFTFEEVDFLIPNAQLDTIIRLGHISFEVAHIKIGELLHIYQQAPLDDWQILKDEARLMGWPKTFEKITGTLELLHQILFKKPFLKKGNVSIFPKTKMEFPFNLPFCMLAGGVIEKKAWKKIYGARFIIRERINSWIRKTF